MASQFSQTRGVRPLKGIRSIFPFHLLNVSNAVVRGQVHAYRGGYPRTRTKGITPEFAINSQRFSVAKPLALSHHVHQRFRTAATRGTDRKKTRRPIQDIPTSSRPSFPLWDLQIGSVTALQPNHRKHTDRSNTLLPRVISALGSMMIIIGRVYENNDPISSRWTCVKI